MTVLFKVHEQYLQDEATRKIADIKKTLNSSKQQAINHTSKRVKQKESTTENLILPIEH